MADLVCPSCGRRSMLVGVPDDTPDAESECVSCSQRRLERWKAGGRRGPDPRDVPLVGSRPNVDRTEVTPRGD